MSVENKMTSFSKTSNLHLLNLLGPFLTMLLNKLSRVLSQPYRVNLLVTSIVSRLCLMPHPHLHELFTDPLTPLRPNARGVYTIIQVVRVLLRYIFTQALGPILLR